MHVGFSRPTSELLYCRYSIFGVCEQYCVYFQFYTPQLDFDLRTVRPLPLSYNNLLDPHLKHFFNHPAKRRVLEKRGFITKDGDVICHSMKELNQYRDFLYWNHQEMLNALRSDMNAYMPKILAKRRAIAVSKLY